jgi:hypothetical protein
MKPSIEGTDGVITIHFRPGKRGANALQANAGLFTTI